MTTGRPRERICKRGHDTEEVGRVPNNGWCRACARMAEERGGSITGKLKHNHPIEWERARVERWLEIVRDDPLTLDINLKSTQLRGREFQVRYEKLEAVVPTPVDA
jgi:hypothetical protein